MQKDIPHKTIEGAWKDTFIWSDEVANIIMTTCLQFNSHSRGGGLKSWGNIDSYFVIVIDSKMYSGTGP